MALLDPLGGHLAINLATAAAGAATVVGIARLVRTWGHANGDLIALAFLAAPGTVIAATSTGDYLAPAFFIWAALCHLHDRSVRGRCAVQAGARDRLSSVFLVAAFLVADGGTGQPAGAPAHRAVALPLGALLYVPAWLAYDRSAEILDTAEGWRSFTNNLGGSPTRTTPPPGCCSSPSCSWRAGAGRRPAALGPRPHVAHRRAGLRRVAGPVLRAAVEVQPPAALPGHVPAVAGRQPPQPARVPVADDRRAGGQRADHLPSFGPDAPAVARAGRWDPALTVGLLVNDIDCRLDAMHDDPPPLNRRAWACTLEPIRGAAEDPIDAG